MKVDPFALYEQLKAEKIIKRMAEVLEKHGDVRLKVYLDKDEIKCRIMEPYVSQEADDDEFQVG